MMYILFLLSSAGDHDGHYGKPQARCLFSQRHPQHRGRTLCRRTDQRRLTAHGLWNWVSSWDQTNSSTLKGSKKMMFFLPWWTSYIHNHQYHYSRFCFHYQYYVYVYSVTLIIVIFSEIYIFCVEFLFILCVFLLLFFFFFKFSAYNHQ